MSVSQRIQNASAKVQKEVHDGVDALVDGTKRVGRGTLAGFLGGLVASWAMNQYQAIESKPVRVRREELRLQYASARTGRINDNACCGGDEPTVKLAERVSRNLFEHELTPCEKKIAGPAIQYGLGGLVGAVYGGLSELTPGVSSGFGIPFATMLWVLGSETAGPALGLSKPPAEVPVQKHASDLATHFVYGMTLDISRRILRRLL